MLKCRRRSTRALQVEKEQGRGRSTTVPQVLYWRLIDGLDAEIWTRFKLTEPVRGPITRSKLLPFNKYLALHNP